MSQERAQRRLAAILAADVVGYARLMEADEGGTLSALRIRRSTVLEPLVAQHDGRVVKHMGDGFLVEFASAVNAVECAVDLQRMMEEANAGVLEDRHIVLRVGINLGDIVVEAGDIFGDGVNIAARLEQIAPPGGIIISQKVRDEIERKVSIACEDLGEQALKHIATPIRVHRVVRGAARGEQAGSEPAPPSAVSSKPSIVVLPFANMSGDPEQQYFSDGITEDIITELSRYRSLFVIARNSSFQLRGPAVDTATVRRRLGIRYVAEGSVRRSGSRLRVTAQLVDAATETQLWAERYDRDIQDVFAIQEEIARTIATTLEGRVAASGVEQAKRKPTTELAAYDYFLQGRERHAHYDSAAAARLYAKAIDLDPGYVHAHAFLAVVLAVQHWLDPQPETLQRAEVCARAALALDDQDPASHDAMGFVALHQRRFDLAGMHLERAVTLNPNDVYIAADHANWLIRSGRPGEGLLCLDAAMRRDPYPPTWLWELRSNALFHLKRYDEAIAALRNMTALHSWHHAHFAAAYALLDRPEEARRAASEFLAAMPGGSIATFAAAEPYAEQALLDHLLDGLHKAGLPE